MRESKTAYAYLIEHMQEPSFYKIRDLACDFVKKLPKELCDELHDSLNRGIDILDSEALLQMYFYSFGDMHAAKLSYAFDHLQNYIPIAEKVELVDYGCGQGLASVCYHDYVKGVNPSQEITRIILIDPSEMALSRASLLCSVFYPKAETITIKKSFDRLLKNDIILSKEIPSIHLFSNILDVESFDIKTFAQIVKAISVGENEYIITSPIQNVNRLRRLKDFVSILDNNLYFEQYLDKREFREDKDWTCAVLLCSSKGNKTEFDLNLNEIYETAVSIIENKNRSEDKCRKVFHLLNVGALTGDMRCQNALGCFYKEGIGTKKDEKKSFEWFQKSANQGFKNAIYNLSTCFINGIGTEINYPKAVGLLLHLCDLGDIMSFNSLAICYMKGLGVEENPQKAIELWEYASQQNDPTAKRNLGAHYLMGYKIKKNIEKGLSLLKTASEKNDVIASRMLGRCYRYGIGERIDIPTAIMYYTKSGLSDDIESIKTLVEIFEEKDYKQFFRDEQFDVFAKGVHLGIPQISKVTITWLNRETKCSQDGEVVYGCNGLRLVRTIRKSSEVRSELVLLPIKTSYYRVKEGTRVICGEAFSDWKELQEIELPLTINFIGGHAFLNCIKLNHVVLPNSVLYIGFGAFDCDGHAFLGERSEKRRSPLKITIPSSVLVIDGNPFCQNTIITCNNKRFKVVDNVLYSSDGKTLISYCSSKTEYTVPSGVERIGIGAFRDTTIKKIHLPDTLKIIDKYAFSDADELDGVSFPESLREIHEKAFDWCDFHSGFISLPSSVEHIDSEAFDFDWHIKLIKVPKGRVDYYKAILPEWVSSQITDEDFIFESGLFLDNDRSVLISVYSGNDDIVIPDGITTIKDNAFDGRYEIESITFPRSLIDLPEHLFDDELSLNHLYVPKGLKSFFSSKLQKYKDIIEEIE